MGNLFDCICDMLCCPSSNIDANGNEMVDENYNDIELDERNKLKKKQNHQCIKNNNNNNDENIKTIDIEANNAQNNNDVVYKICNKSTNSVNFNENSTNDNVSTDLSDILSKSSIELYFDDNDEDNESSYSLILY